MVRLRRHGVLEPMVVDEVLVSVGIGPAGEAIALWAAPAARDVLLGVATSAGGARFPKARAEGGVTARLTTHRPDLVDVTPLAELSVAHPHVQPLPHGRSLVVGARCHWRPDGAECNALVFDAHGELALTGTFGDGIEHVLTTPSGAIWTGYFDEGVYGNYGWGALDSPEPIGRHGLLRWTPALDVAWEYPFDTAFGVIDDCYALNLDGEVAWASYYSDFPVVQIDGRDRVHGWRTEVAGARALAVDGSVVAFFGGYGEDRDRLVVGHLDREAIELVSATRLVDPDGRRLGPATVVGRGAELHVITPAGWWKVAVEDVV